MQPKRAAPRPGLFATGRRRAAAAAGLLRVAPPQPRPGWAQWALLLSCRRRRPTSFPGVAATPDVAGRLLRPTNLQFRQIFWTKAGLARFTQTDPRM